MQKGISATKGLEQALNQVKALETKDTPEKEPVDIYALIGLQDHNWGCIMLDTELIDVKDIAEAEEGDLFFDAGEPKYLQGAVAESSAHITLLYGLLSSGLLWKDAVDAALAEKDIEVSELTIDKVSFFDNPNKDHYCIIALIDVTDELSTANAQLRKYLPHIDTFPEYKPHVTLAYIKKDEAIRDRWVQKLGTKLNGSTLKVTGLNYGD